MKYFVEGGNLSSGAEPVQRQHQTAPPASESAKLPLSALLGVRVLARTRSQRDVLEGAARRHSVISTRSISVPQMRRSSLVKGGWRET